MAWRRPGLPAALGSRTSAGARPRLAADARAALARVLAGSSRSWTPSHLATGEAARPRPAPRRALDRHRASARSLSTRTNSRIRAAGDPATLAPTPSPRPAFYRGDAGCRHAVTPGAGTLSG